MLLPVKEEKPYLSYKLDGLWSETNNELAETLSLYASSLYMTF